MPHKPTQRPTVSDPRDLPAGAQDALPDSVPGQFADAADASGETCAAALHSNEGRTSDSSGLTSESAAFRLPGNFKSKLSMSQLEKISHRLGRSLKAGVPVATAWQNETRMLRGALKDRFQKIHSEIKTGGSVAAAVARQNCFPPMFAEMVHVGEETGRLDEAFMRLADHYRHLMRMRRTFVQLITWPVLQLVAAAMAITLIFVALDWLESNMALFKAPDMLMLGLSPIGNLALFWSVIVLGCGAALLGAKGTVSGWFGQWPMRLALRIPLLGNVVKAFSLSRFAWSFGTAIGSGMDAKPAIRLGVRSTQNHYYAAHENMIATRVGQGSEFVTALRESDVFPEDLLETVQVGELTGELTECLERLSDDYREQAEFSLRTLSQVSGFAVVILVAAMTGTGVVLMYANYLGTLNEAMSDSVATAEQIQSSEQSTNPITAAKNKAVKDFLENNEDFKKIESAYENLSNINKMSPNEFLDGF